jgi:hypothetical protein
MCPHRHRFKTPNRKISVSWQHFDDNRNRYVSVRMGRGGGAEISVSQFVLQKKRYLKKL